MTHACPGTWFPSREDNTETPALSPELDSIITNNNSNSAQLLPSTASFLVQDIEIESNESAEAADNLAIAGVTTDIASLNFHRASLTPSTDPSDNNDDEHGDVESIVYSDDSSSTVVPRVPTPRPRPAQTSRVAPHPASDSAAVDSSTSTEFQTENTHVNGNFDPAVSSSESSPAVSPTTASTSSRPRSNTRPRATTRARSATLSSHAFDHVPDQTEPFPDYVDTSPPQNNTTTLANGVNGVTTTTTTTPADENEAPLPSTEALRRRTRREEIHYSDQVRANILANIFGRSAVDERGRLLPETEGGPVRSSSLARPITSPIDDSDSESGSPDFDTSYRRASPSDTQASNTYRQSSDTSYRQASTDAQPSNTSYGRAPATYSQASPVTNGQTLRYGQRFTYRGLYTSNQTSTPYGQTSPSSQSSTNSQGVQPISYRRITASSYGRGTASADRQIRYTQIIYGPSNSNQAPTSGQSSNYPQAPTNPGSSITRQTTISSGQFPGGREALASFVQALAAARGLTNRQPLSTTQASTSPGSTTRQTSTVSEQASSSHGQSLISGQDFRFEQAFTSGQFSSDHASTSEQASTSDRDSTSGHTSTSGQASTSTFNQRSTSEQASTSNNSDLNSTGTSNNNQRISRNNRTSGPEDCRPYIDGITRFRRDEDEGDGGPSSTSTGGITALNNAYSIASMSINPNSNHGNNTHNANSGQGLFTNFLDNSNNNTANMNMSRQGTPTSSSGPQHPANQVNGASGMSGMGMGMNVPMNAGHQMDLNHLYEMVLELSDVLKNNRDMTKGIINSAEEIMVSAFVYLLFPFRVPLTFSMVLLLFCEGFATCVTPYFDASLVRVIRSRKLLTLFSTAPCYLRRGGPISPASQWGNHR